MVHSLNQPKQVRGKLDVDATTLLYANVDAMTQRLDQMNVNTVNSNAVAAHDHPPSRYYPLWGYTAHTRARSP